MKEKEKNPNFSLDFLTEAGFLRLPPKNETVQAYLWCRTHIVCSPKSD